MANVDPTKRYSDDHEWAQLDPNDPTVALVGVSDYAQGHLGDIVLVEAPAVGDEISAGQACGAVESPKAVGDFFAPVSGEVIAVNEELEDAPELVNEDCYGRGWIAKVRLSDPSELDKLMDAAAYETFLADLDED